MSRPAISIIVPTLNEAANLPALTGRIDRAMAGRNYEIIIVDDNSHDGTESLCASLSEHLPLRLLVRRKPRNGLSGAVLEGMAAAEGQLLVVMDADLQHPPEMIPRLLAPLENGQSDFVLGSRYATGGSTDGRWSMLRRLNSWGATLLARPLAGAVNDPMSGFFALRKQTFLHARQLTPLGYKIALELMCKCEVRHVTEQPIHFERRAAGESKLSARQQFRYLEHLSRLYDFAFPRLSPCLKFLVATAVAWFVGLGGLMLLAWTGMALAPAIALSYLAGLAATAAFHLRYTRTQREFLPWPHPWRAFWGIGLAEWLTCAASSAWLWTHLRWPHMGTLFALSFGCATVVRYILRKELLQDIRGLGPDARRESISLGSQPRPAPMAEAA